MNLIWFSIKFVRRGSEFEIFPVKWLGWPLWENKAAEGSECSSDNMKFQAETEEVIEVVVRYLF